MSEDFSELEPRLTETARASLGGLVFWRIMRGVNMLARSIFCLVCWRRIRHWAQRYWRKMA